MTGVEVVVTVFVVLVVVLVAALAIGLARRADVPAPVIRVDRGAIDARMHRYLADGTPPAGVDVEARLHDAITRDEDTVTVTITPDTSGVERALTEAERHAAAWERIWNEAHAAFHTQPRTAPAQVATVRAALAAVDRLEDFR